LKDLPNWSDSYWIGDAFATLYPAIGSGFSHGIQSAKLAAQCYQQTQASDYHKRNLSNIKPKLFWGKCINQILQHPYLTASLMPLLQKKPKNLNFILNKIGYIN
jgi:flavin-dependent dehydrogenase